MITPAGLIISSARRTMFADNGRRISRSALIASGLAVLIFITIVIFFRDRSMVEVAVVELPPRPPAELLNEPQPPAPELQKNLVSEVAVHEDVAAIPEALPEPMTPVVPRREPAPKVAPDAGQVGRARAQAATAELAKATSKLDQALGDLDGALRTTTAGYEPAVRRRALVRGGRGAGDLGAVDAGRASSGAGADLGSAVKGQSVAIGSLTASDASASDDASGPSGAAAPGVYRTNASLLAVIQRYAAGIQYCYGNELKRDPSLRGKLVVAITVDAAGRVTAADAIQNTVGSQALATCALSQIRDWRFPAIPRGVTTFQAPFVFTPPN